MTPEHAAELAKRGIKGYTPWVYAWSKPEPTIPCKGKDCTNFVEDRREKCDECKAKIKRAAYDRKNAARIAKRASPEHREYMAEAQRRSRARKREAALARERDRYHEKARAERAKAAPAPTDPEKHPFSRAA